MSDAVIEPGHLKCPNCATPMNRHRFASADVRPLEVDVCYPCHAIWFDQHESARLSADGVVDLFRFIHERGGASTARLSSNMGCARCRTRLEPASDIACNNRFSYHRCPQGHGRMTTFLHFLREKQFVRDLTLAERQKLAAHVRQIKCTSCSGPIDIAQHAACTYCGAAVSVLDKDATQKALDHYLKERQRQGRPVPVMAPTPPSQRNYDLEYLMFDLGTDIVGAFARAAARPAANAFAAVPAEAAAIAAAAATDVASLPTLDAALAQSGLGESLSLVDVGGNGAIGEALTGGLASDLASGLADSAGSLADGAASAATDVVADGGLVDLVSDGIGAIVEGVFS
ncbi:MAG: zf-TFIIB domain-containing protein [Betaproteobacteria bacterium]|nr:zf-TFIIB domain-containing protein [Betaproteobacteria bacterium]